MNDEKHGYDLRENAELSKTLRICARQRCPKCCPRYGIEINGEECARRLMEDAAARLDRTTGQVEVLAKIMTKKPVTKNE